MKPVRPGETHECPTAATRRSHDMTKKLYLAVSGTIFLLVGFFHLLRLVYQWPIVVGTAVIPHALSFVGCPVSLGYAAWASWLLLRKQNMDRRAPKKFTGNNPQ